MAQKKAQTATKKFRHEVMIYAGEHTLSAAAKKYKVSVPIINYWLDLALGIEPTYVGVTRPRKNNRPSAVKLENSTQGALLAKLWWLSTILANQL